MYVYNLGFTFDCVSERCKARCRSFSLSWQATAVANFLFSRTFAPCNSYGSSGTLIVYDTCRQRAALHDEDRIELSLLLCRTEVADAVLQLGSHGWASQRQPGRLLESKQNKGNGQTSTSPNEPVVLKQTRSNNSQHKSKHAYVPSCCRCVCGSGWLVHAPHARRTH